MKPPSLAREFARRVATQFPVEFAGDVDQVAMQLARHYLGAMQLPGAASRPHEARHQSRGGQPRGSRRSQHAAVDTLAAHRPAEGVLDEREGVELAESAEFFSTRVMGQTRP